LASQRFVSTDLVGAVRLKLEKARELVPQVDERGLVNEGRSRGVPALENITDAS
jgi:hypothetical protein